MISVISLFEIINFVVHSRICQTENFLWIPDADAVNTNGLGTLFVNGLVTFFINGKPTYINGPSSLPRNQPNCIIFEIYV